MRNNECIAMILAGGQGSRLGVLTRDVAKPAVQFGGKYRIIDFPLSNCANSGIDTVGILTQYKPLELNTYIGSGQNWDLDRTGGGAFTLPPYMTESTGKWYKGTANAIYQNIQFIDKFCPKYVVILSGDHIYKMDYSDMLKKHKTNNADVTIAMIEVGWNEASRFGILSVDDNDRVVEFAEKPSKPKSNTASMGIYIFSWDVLRKQLIDDENDSDSDNDFGKNIIPKMLAGGQAVYGYHFSGYWKDVGTVESLWESNMDLLDGDAVGLHSDNWPIMYKSPLASPQFIGCHANVTDSLVTEGCYINGKVCHSIIFDNVTVEEGAVIEDSILLSGVTVKRGSKIRKAIVASGANIGNNCTIGYSKDSSYLSNYCSGDVTLIGGVNIADNTDIGVNNMITKNIGGK